MRKKLNSSKRFDTLISGDRYLCGVAAAVVGTVASAAIGGAAANSAASKQAKAAGQASDASLAASQSSNALQRDMYDQNRADSAPWRESGTVAMNQLSMLMGLPGYESGANANAYNPNALANAKLVDTSSGIPQMNGALYSSNADYRKAWDDMAAWHQGRFGQGYTEGSNVNDIERSIRASLQPAINAEKAAQATQAQNGLATPNANFGKLSKSFTMADYQADPGYQFRLDQGNKSVEQSAAARGSQLSGATMKALQKYGQGVASDEYGNAYNRFNNDQATQFNRLSGIAGTGQQQVNALGQAGQNFANAVGNNTMNTANQIGQNTMGAADARAASYMQTARGINSAVGTGINAYQQQQYLNNMGNNNMTAYGTYKGSQQSNMLAAQDF